MAYLSNPTSMEELKERIPVVGISEPIKVGYVLEYSGSDLVLNRYENGNHIYEDSIDVGFMCYDDFNSFISQLRKHIGRKKVYISADYASVLLAIINGGEPEDYEE